MDLPTNKRLSQGGSSNLVQWWTAPLPAGTPEAEVAGPPYWAADVSSLLLSSSSLTIMFLVIAIFFLVDMDFITYIRRSHLWFRTNGINSDTWLVFWRWHLWLHSGRVSDSWNCKRENLWSVILGIIKNLNVKPLVADYRHYSTWLEEEFWRWGKLTRTYSCVTDMGSRNGSAGRLVTDLQNVCMTHRPDWRRGPWLGKESVTDLPPNSWHEKTTRRIKGASWTETDLTAWGNFDLLKKPWLVEETLTDWYKTVTLLNKHSTRWRDSVEIFTDWRNWLSKLWLVEEAVTDSRHFDWLKELWLDEETDKQETEEE